jgi:hypothetical protein
LWSYELTTWARIPRIRRTTRAASFECYYRIVLDPIYIPVLSFVGTLAVVVVGFLYNNSRITDLRSSLEKLIDANSRSLEKVTDANNRSNDASLRRVEDLLLHKFAELDNRLSRIESHLQM